ncbi:MAG TPA: ribonuclease P protein component [Patescibacteria group bacterium]|nr:ribonuclease P protein component [Patescibacteria group bacterium]
MLPRANRLSLAKEFRRFKERGRSLETPFFRFNYLPTTGVPRFGFVVTNKIGKAAARNRSRRILREVVKSKMEVMPPIEAVFIGRSRLPEATYDEVLASFTEVLSKISLPR